MVRVESRLSATRCAVPAFIRVDPAIGSAPVSRNRMIRLFQERSRLIIGDADCQCAAFFASRMQQRKRRRAAGGDGDQRITCANGVMQHELAACSASSSAPSVERSSASSPPAIKSSSRSGGQLKVGMSSAPSWTASRPEVPAPA